MSKSVNLLVVGRGKIWAEISAAKIRGVVGVSHPHDDTWNIEGGPTPGNTEIAVHCGSGKQFLLLTQYCEKWGVPLIQMSSSLKESSAPDAKELKLPEDLAATFPLINAPNLALPIVALLRILPAYGQMMQKLGGHTDVLESHQASKKSAPITAQKIAGYYGADPNQVRSIRDEVVQKNVLGVPVEHLGGHAYHFIVTTACSVEVGLHTKVHGRHPYVEGLEVLIKKIVEMGDTLKPGIHQADELLFG